MTALAFTVGAVMGATAAWLVAAARFSRCEFCRRRLWCADHDRDQIRDVQAVVAMDRVRDANARKARQR